MTTSVAEEVGNVFPVDNNRACSDGRSGENECGGCERTEAGNGGTKKRLLYNESRQREKLLYLLKIWPYGLTL